MDEVNPPLTEQSEEEETRERSEQFDRFEDEPPIENNVYPDSASDSDSDSETLIPRREGNKASMGSRGNEILYRGQIFWTKDSIKATVLDHALTTGRNIKRTRHDKDKIAFCCVGENCEWKLYASISGGDDKWEVKTLVNEHTCVPNGVCQVLKVPVIANLFVDKIRDEPDYYMPMKIEELIKEKWNINVSRRQCQAARNEALKWIKTEYDAQFERLRDYAAEILVSNPNSTVEIDTTPNADGVDMFQSIYVCFQVLKKGWKDTCRPLIGLDGCFLKSTMKGQLLVALGRDDNNCIYPIAWGVVQIEDTKNWSWFLQNLKSDLDIEDGEGYVIISDRQKGLLNAVEAELPACEHRMCVKHIYNNLKKKHGKKPGLKPMIWNLAWSYNDYEYKQSLKRILHYDLGIYMDILEAKPETFCRSFYKIGSCSEDVDNNSVESFNATILKAREKPIVPMLEMIAYQAMARIEKRSVQATSHGGVCTPYVQKVLAEQLPITSKCIVRNSTHMRFNVHQVGCAHSVCLRSRSCSCRKWELTGIPCQHAYAVMIKKGLVVEEYTLFWFRTTTWQNTYRDGINPVAGHRFWPQTEGPAVIRPPSPPQTGRKKKAKKQKRIKGVNESPTKKATKLKKRKMHCGLCGESGHNAKGHRKRLQNQSQGGSQSEGGSQTVQEESQTTHPVAE